MRYFIGSTCASWLERLSAPGLEFGMILGPGRSWRNPHCVYACDNNVYASWLKGENWNVAMESKWMAMLGKIPRQRPPEWVLLPDAVGDWGLTLSMAEYYMPVVRGKGLRVALALQDGCAFTQALSLEPDTVFIAGSTEWKEAAIGPAAAFFRGACGVHVGRVNTRRRLRLCQAAGVDSVDGTALNKWPRHAQMIHSTLYQPCLHL